MPSDIRSFFGGGGGSSQGAASAKPTKTNGTTEKPKGRGKRKVVSDSESDEDGPKKKATPKKATPKKSTKREGPKVEITTTGDYFASKGSKPARSEAVKAKPAAKESPAKAKPAAETPKATPKKQSAPTPTSTHSIRTSSRRVAVKNYAEDVADDLPAHKKKPKADDDSGDDIFGADYKRGGKKMEDEYESSEDEELVVDEKKTRAAAARKRKSADLSDDDDEQPPAPPPKAAAKAKKASPKKAAPQPAAKRTKKAANDEPENEAMQDIFDSIPTVRPPTPPPRDPDQKFDWRAAQGRAAPAPAAPGSKEVPEGAENCLAGLTFVFTGVLESISRDEGQDLVKRYGGKVTTSPSSKTDFVVLGTDAGPKKLETIRKLGIKTVNEDGLFALISRLPAHGGSGKNAQKAEEKRQKEEQKIEQAAKEMEEEEKRKAKKAQAPPPPGTTATKVVNGDKKASNVEDRLWTTKYAPTQMTHIIGNKAAVEKLQNWLRNWRKNAKANFKKPGPDGSGLYRAAIIHGSPGIGKTTAAHLVAQMEGYDVVESNASDTRSKKLVETGLKGVMDTTSLLGYFAGDGQKADAKKNLLLIMDEVDGMSAGDRGGVGAMAAVCRKTNIPIILICNDRRLPKMKPFDHVTYDLPFRKPTTDQVRGRIQTILFREGMRDMMPTTVVNALIEGSGADIRRIINMLSTAKMDAQALSFEEGKKMSSAWEKHVILKPWDLCSKILSPGMFAASSKASLNDKIELYFNDHEFSSLMLQENYLSTNMSVAQQHSGRERTLKMLELADKAAESISDGDLCDAMIHGSQQHWSLMPTHAILSFVRPASFVHGMVSSGVRFTSWLGNNSKAGKLSRFVKEIQSHMRLRTSADRHEIRQQYLPVLWTQLIKRLEVDGGEAATVEAIIALMDSYFLTKDDWDAILELGVGPQDADTIKIAPAAKSSFTRKYNVMSHPLPFMKASGAGVGPLAKKGRDKPDLEEAIEESEDDDALVDPAVAAADDDEEELDLKKDKYVQAPKKKKAAGAGAAGSKKGKAKAHADADADASEHDAKPAKSAKGKARGKK